MNIVYLLTGIFAGIVLWHLFITYIDPIIQIKQETYKYYKTDEATYYNINTQRQIYDLQREYPELKDEEEPKEKNTVDVVGFQYYPDETYYDDEDDDDIE